MSMDTVDTVLTGCSSGRPEIFDDEDGDGNGKWRGICDDGLEGSATSTEEAAVLCRQLGFSGNTPHGSTTPSLTITKPTAFLLDDVVCDSDEDELLDCDHADRGVNNCQATEHAGVGCSQAKTCFVTKLGFNFTMWQVDEFRGTFDLAF